MPSDERDPLLSFHFGLDVSGKVTGFFTECSGIGSESEVVDHKIVDDGGKESVRKIPGRLKWTDVTLKRGITNSMDIWNWRKMVEDGDTKGARANGSITMYSNELKPIAEWTLTNCWPSKVSGPALKSDSNEFGVEELVIVHEGLVRTK